MEKICELVISGGAFVGSLDEAVFGVAQFIAEVVLTKTVGMPCSALGGGEHGGGEGGGPHDGGGPGPGGGGGGPCYVCAPDDPGPSDGSGP